MSLLDGFKVFDFNEGSPYLSATKNGINFNKSVVLKLNKPEYVVFLINKEKKQVAVQVCQKDTPNAIQFYKEKASGVLSVRWNGKDLLNTISEMMGWDLENRAYRADGTLLEDENAILFDMANASEMA